MSPMDPYDELANLIETLASRVRGYDEWATSVFGNRPTTQAGMNALVENQRTHDEEFMRSLGISYD